MPNIEARKRNIETIWTATNIVKHYAACDRSIKIEALSRAKIGVDGIAYSNTTKETSEKAK